MPEIVPVLLALFALLIGVSLLMPLADRLSLPSTMLLAAFGLLLGLFAYWMPPEATLFGVAAPVGDVVHGLAQLGLDTDAFLYIFLPPLLFAAGITVDLRLMMDEIGAVLVMAVVAVVVCIGFVGFALDAISGFGLVVCLLLGAIVATTDPSAVLAIFGDIGALRRLRVLVAGESLFNDAAAIALFAIFFEMLAGFRAPEFSRGVMVFLTDFFGGVLLGYVLARVAAALFNLLRETPAAAITVSVALAYLAFILGESYLSVSGVIAVVTASLTTAIYGPVRLAPAAWRGLLRIWAQLEFWANALIFVLASMLAVEVLTDANWGDLGLLAVLVVAALAARGFVLQLLLPLLTAFKLVEPIDQKYRTVILWGGLRGAVTLALALSVSNDPRIFEEARHFIGVLATGFVFFTLFVSAPTLKPLLQLLGLDRLSPTEQALRDRVWELSRSQIRAQVKATAEEYGFEKDLAEDLPIGETAEEQGRPEELAKLSEQEREAVGLLALATRERELYLAHFDERSISSRLVSSLTARADKLLDAATDGGVAGYRAVAEKLLQHSWRLRLAMWLQRRCGWTRPLTDRLAGRFEILIVSQMVLRELLTYCRRSIKPLLGGKTTEALLEVLQERMALVDDALKAVEVQYPSYAAALRAQYLTRAALRLEDEAYHRHLGESLISREVFNDLQRDLAARRAASEARPPLDIGVNLTRIMRRVPLFENLEDEQLLRVAELLSARLASPGERIVTKGEKGKAMYFIATGEAEVMLPDSPIRLETGDFFGEMALLHKQPRVADVVTRGYCNLLVLERRDFQRLLASSKELRREIEKVAAARMEEAEEKGAA